MNLDYANIGSLLRLLSDAYIQLSVCEDSYKAFKIIEQIDELEDAINQMRKQIKFR